LAQALDVSPSMVELASGATARQKLFLVRGAPETLARKLAALAGPPA
jgi:uncharacterized protein YggU (UPF0235/DUF167 family)